MAVTYFVASAFPLNELREQAALMGLQLPAEAADRMLMTTVLVEFYEFDTSPSQVRVLFSLCRDSVPFALC